MTWASPPACRPVDDCTDAQTACKQAPNGNGPDGEPEVSDNILRLVLFYSRNLAVPARRDVNAPEVLAGKTLFYPGRLPVLPHTEIHHRRQRRRT